jgi:hypothetical protein
LLKPLCLNLWLLADARDRTPHHPHPTTHIPITSLPCPRKGGAEWVLEEVYDPNTNRQLKRDPATGLVYSELVPGEWPQVVGVQDAAGVLRMTQRRDDGGLFAALDGYLRTQK